MKNLYILFFFFCFLTDISITHAQIMQPHSGMIVPNWKILKEIPDLNYEYGSVELRDMKPKIDSDFLIMKIKTPINFSNGIVTLTRAEENEEGYEIELEWEKDICNIFEDNLDPEQSIKAIFSLFESEENNKLWMFLCYYPQINQAVVINNRLKNSDKVRALTLFPDGGIGSYQQDKNNPDKWEPIVNMVQQIWIVDADKVQNEVPDDYLIQEHDNDIFYAVEQPAEFPGGIHALMQWLSNNVKYPEEAQQSKIEGRVITKFVIEKDGTVSDVQVTTSVNPVLDAEAVRVIKNMPKWRPGKNNDIPVRTYFNLPISFKLPEVMPQEE